MTESKRTVDQVQAAIDAFLSEQATILADISPDLEPFVSASSSLLAGGKRFRAQFCYWGWRASGRGPDDNNQPIVQAAAALELFHAAALVHDDVIDNSDTRRGKPSAHKRFEALHRSTGWTGDADAFGRSSAILLGDLLLGWSDELLDNAIRLLANPLAGTQVRRAFNRMRTEVTAGQYLDVLGEHSWRSWPEGEHLERAQRVAVYKSAKYSIEAPLLVGSALGGARPDQARSLSDFGLPLGIAFQLRDDLLGVFGDPDETGKPSGDDLREGKRTVLIAQARRRLPAPSVRLLDELLGDPHLSQEQVSSLQATLRGSGAVDDVERAIERHAIKATDALETAKLEPEAREALLQMVDVVTRRAL